MIPLIEKTWVFWWMFAIFMILRWFHLFSSPADDSAIEGPASGED